MSVRHLPHHQIDRAAWDACIAEAANGRIYGYSWYLDEICPNWEGLVWEDYAAVMPLVYRKRLGIAYLFLPFSAQQLGVFGAGADDPDRVAAFVSAVPDRFRVADLKLNETNPYNKTDWEIIANKNYELLLDRSVEELAQAFSANAKRDLKKAEKAQLTTAVGITPHTEVMDLFRSTKGGQFAALDDRFYTTLDRLYRASAQRNMAHTRTVRDAEGQLVTTGLFLEDDKRIIYILSGNTAVGRKTGGMRLLIYDLIRDRAGSGKLLDFEGSNDPQLARFYKSFGARESVYLQLRKNTLPGLFKPLLRF